MRSPLRGLGLVAGVVLLASNAAAQGANAASASQGSDPQMIALDTVFKTWKAEGKLTGKTVVVDSRPALSSIQDQGRGHGRVADERPAARAAAATNRLAAAIGGRAATESEQTPCAAGKCNFTPDLAMVILGDPVVTGNKASVTVGVSIVYRVRGALRPQVTYHVVSLERTGNIWRTVSAKLAGRG